VYLPDIAGWRIDRVPEPPDARPVRIAPDWVCEILSPSTAARDMGPKRLTYHHAKVGHYWVVHPAEQLLHVHRWGDEGYHLVLAANAGEIVRAEPFDAIEIAIADLFGLPPRAR
jgi:Uma2 family endonuclease